MRLRVPTKVVFVGDHVLGERDRKFSAVQMDILEKQMRHQKLKQGWRTVPTPSGGVVECWSCFTLRQITIYAAGGGKKKKKKVHHCFCIGCVALARVAKIHDITFLENDPTTELDDLCYDRVDAYPARSAYFGAYPVYDLDVCGGESYSRFEGVAAIDNTPYCVGDLVLVTPYPHNVDMPEILDVYCYTDCSFPCFASPGSPVISVAILPINVDRIPLWLD